MVSGEEINSTIVVFYSISGSAGKTFLAATLYQYWLAQRLPTLLVDADILGASLSRMAMGGLLPGITEDSRTKSKLFASDLADGEFKLPNNSSFMFAAPWLQDDNLISKSIGTMPTNREQLDGFLAQNRATESLPKSLEKAQDTQARLAGDHGAQRRFWANLFRDATRTSRNIIVDLPAQGPSGVSLTSQWSRVRADAAVVLSNARKARGRSVTLRLARVLVFASEAKPPAEEEAGNPDPKANKPGKEMRQHALIRTTIEGTKDELSDIVVVENFSFLSQGTQIQAGSRKLDVPPLKSVLASPSPMTNMIGHVKGIQSDSDTAEKLANAIQDVSAIDAD